MLKIYIAIINMSTEKLLYTSISHITVSESKRNDG